jgi:cysteine-rich repeat protein
MQKSRVACGVIDRQGSSAWGVLVLAASVAAAACGNDQTTVDTSSKDLIVDDAHGGGNGLFFLPPLVPRSDVAGKFKTGLSPVVRIDDLAGPGGKVLGTLATYTTTSGPERETVRVEDSAYMVDWHTHKFDLDTKHVYRINVLLDGRVLGFADVQPVKTPCGMRNVNTKLFVPLVDGRTLPIKFWLNRCAPVVCAEDPCNTAGTCDVNTGRCAPAPKPNGTACNDGNLCTKVDTCRNGACVGSEPVVCVASDQCHAAGTCDPANGRCSDPTKADGASCDDGDVCTQGDSCKAGICIAGPASGLCGGSHLCGNASVDAGEECDDGNTVSGDGCSALCKNEYCGDGIVTSGIRSLRFVWLGRSCGATPADIVFSLNGVQLARVPLPNTCDCRPGIQTVAVTDTRLLALGRVGLNNLQVQTTGELAWARRVMATRWWESDATIWDAGGGDDDVLQTPDLCTAGAQAGVSAVSEFAISPWEGEDCDDGNTLDGDGCSANCTREACGNGIIDPNEQCDDGNTANGDGCSASCKTEFCGDGIVTPGIKSLAFTWLGRSCGATPPADIVFSLNGVELARAPLPNRCDCMPGIQTVAVTDPRLLALGTVGIDHLRVETTGELAWARRQMETRWWQSDATLWDAGGGDDDLLQTPDLCAAGAQAGVSATTDFGISRWEGEDCDDGNTVGGDGCSADCSREVCGNGVLDPNEQCDDGNTVDGDGCTATCRVGS